MCGGPAGNFPPEKVFKARILEPPVGRNFENNGCMILLLGDSQPGGNGIVIGNWKYLRRQMLWKNARQGYLGVNYNIWPRHKKIAAHLRIALCKISRIFAKAKKQFSDIAPIILPGV